MTYKYAKLDHSTITVASAGTAVVAGDDDTILPIRIDFAADTGNGGVIYIGLSDVSSTKHMATLAAKEEYSFDASAFYHATGRFVKRSDFYIDAASNGYKCHVLTSGK